jgi:hypothetical protein
MKRSRIRTVLTILCAFLVLAGGLVWSVHRRVVQNRLNEALFTAIQAKDHVALLEALKAGADPNADDFPAPPSLLETVRGLFRRPHRSGTSMFPLHMALEFGDEFTFKTLLAHKADPNSRTYGAPILYMAANHGDCIHWMGDLLQHGADINARGDIGDTLLHREAFNGDAATIRFLIAHGANVFARDSKGKTVLYGALLSHANLTVLLDAGADINAVSNDGVTPLIEAATEFHEEAVPLLLARGAKVVKYTGKDTKYKSYYMHPLIMPHLKKLGKREP